MAVPPGIGQAGDGELSVVCADLSHFGIDLLPAYLHPYDLLVCVLIVQIVIFICIGDVFGRQITVFGVKAIGLLCYTDKLIAWVEKLTSSGQVALNSVRNIRYYIHCPFVPGILAIFFRIVE